MRPQAPEPPRLRPAQGWPRSAQRHAPMTQHVNPVLTELGLLNDTALNQIARVGKCIPSGG